MQTAQEMKDRESRREREEKPDVQGRCHRAEGENSVWRLKKFQSTPGIEPGTISSVGEHATPTPPTRPWILGYLSALQSFGFVPVIL